VKAEMNEFGQITLTPETSVEAFALKKFVDAALLNMSHEAMREECFWRGSYLTVATGCTSQKRNSSNEHT
jgi:hypothetical protein